MIKEFWYLASPYSRYPAGMETAYTDICGIAAQLFKAGVPVYSPIAHTHAIATIGGFAGHFDQWKDFDEAMIAASCGLIVAMMDGWKESVGVTAEIDICKRMRKPVRYVDPSLTFFSEDNLRQPRSGAAK